ncbi:hypothetical protein MEBOL_001546 [Melittangium boletus DSM 14713]|uniref:Uncharacterized protein n=1 Tax=Melittangium boletus DSM 14713 TaxID=1294270 RepID=A0A250IAA6_9BACT|nr:hypothetical protein MEBOL_001546 [Melittangium boletus DSM 14713]
MWIRPWPRRKAAPRHPFPRGLRRRIPTRFARTLPNTAGAPPPTPRAQPIARRSAPALSPFPRAPTAFRRAGSTLWANFKPSKRREERSVTRLRRASFSLEFLISSPLTPSPGLRARFDLAAGSSEGAPEVCASADEPTTGWIGPGATATRAPRRLTRQAWLCGWASLTPARSPGRWRGRRWWTRRGKRWSLPGGKRHPFPRMAPVPSWWASRGCASANLREALVGPFKRVQVGGVVQVERRVGELHDPPARCGTPRP